MLQAMNTGHDGSLCTLHANSPRDALARLETMVLMAGLELPSRAIREQMVSAVDLIVHVRRFEDGVQAGRERCRSGGNGGLDSTSRRTVPIRAARHDATDGCVGAIVATGNRARASGRSSDDGASRCPTDSLPTRRAAPWLRLWVAVAERRRCWVILACTLAANPSVPACEHAREHAWPPTWEIGSPRGRAASSPDVSCPPIGCVAVAVGCPGWVRLVALWLDRPDQLPRCFRGCRRSPGPRRQKTFGSRGSCSGSRQILPTLWTFSWVRSARRRGSRVRPSTTRVPSMPYAAAASLFEDMGRRLRLGDEPARIFAEPAERVPLPSFRLFGISLGHPVGSRRQPRARPSRWLGRSIRDRVALSTRRVGTQSTSALASVVGHRSHHLRHRDPDVALGAAAGRGFSGDLPWGAYSSQAALAPPDAFGLVWIRTLVRIRHVRYDRGTWTWALGTPGSARRGRNPGTEHWSRGVDDAWCSRATLRQPRRSNASAERSRGACAAGCLGRACGVRWHRIALRGRTGCGSILAAVAITWKQLAVPWAGSNRWASKQERTLLPGTRRRARRDSILLATHRGSLVRWSRSLAMALWVRRPRTANGARRCHRERICRSPWNSSPRFSEAGVGFDSGVERVLRSTDAGSSIGRRTPLRCSVTFWPAREAHRRARASLGSRRRRCA